MWQDTLWLCCILRWWTGSRWATSKSQGPVFTSISKHIIVVLALPPPPVWLCEVLTVIWSLVLIFRTMFQFFSCKIVLKKMCFIIGPPESHVCSTTQNFWHQKTDQLLSNIDCAAEPVCRTCPIVRQATHDSNITTYWILPTWSLLTATRAKSITAQHCDINSNRRQSQETVTIACSYSLLQRTATRECDISL